MQWEKNNYLVENHYYLLKVSIYDSDGNKIHLTDNIIIKNIIDKEYFEIVKSNKLNSEIIVKAKKTTLKNQKIVITSILDQIKS